jgi:hypothetical protein
MGEEVMSPAAKIRLARPLATVAVALPWLMGCASDPTRSSLEQAQRDAWPMSPYYYYTPQPPYTPPPSSGGWITGTANAGETHPPDQTPYRPEPLRPVDPPDAHPVDPSCGWWRLCNFWSGSR